VQPLAGHLPTITAAAPMGAPMITVAAPPRRPQRGRRRGGVRGRGNVNSPGVGSQREPADVLLLNHSPERKLPRRRRARAAVPARTPTSRQPPLPHFRGPDLSLVVVAKVGHLWHRQSPVPIIIERNRGTVRPSLDTRHTAVACHVPSPFRRILLTADTGTTVAWMPWNPR
jgi:hypothetical protein